MLSFLPFPLNRKLNNNFVDYRCHKAIDEMNWLKLHAMCDKIFKSDSV